MINYLPTQANWFTSVPAYSVSQSMLISSLSLKEGTAKGQQRISIAGPCFFHIPLLCNLLCTVTVRPVNALQSYPSLRAVLLPSLTSAFSVSSTFLAFDVSVDDFVKVEMSEALEKRQSWIRREKGRILHSQTRLWMSTFINDILHLKSNNKKNLCNVLPEHLSHFAIL